MKMHRTIKTVGKLVIWSHTTHTAQKTTDTPLTIDTHTPTPAHTSTGDASSDLQDMEYHAPSPPEHPSFLSPSPPGTPSSERDDDNDDNDENDDSPPRAPAPVVPSPREDDNKHAGRALRRRLIGDHVRQAGGMVSPPRQNNTVTKSPFQTWQARANIVTGAANSRQTGTANVYDCAYSLDGSCDWINRRNSLLAYIRHLRSPNIVHKTMQQL